MEGRFFMGDKRKFSLYLQGVMKECAKNVQQAGAELGQAQLQLGLDFTHIFCRFGLSGFSFYFIGLIEKKWFGVLGSLHFKHLRRFNFVDFFL